MDFYIEVEKQNSDSVFYVFASPECAPFSLVNDKSDATVFTANTDAGISEIFNHYSPFFASGYITIVPVQHSAADSATFFYSLDIAESDLRYDWHGRLSAALGTDKAADTFLNVICKNARSKMPRYPVPQSIVNFRNLAERDIKDVIARSGSVSLRNQLHRFRFNLQLRYDAALKQSTMTKGI